MEPLKRKKLVLLDTQTYDMLVEIQYFLSKPGQKPFFKDLIRNMIDDLHKELFPNKVVK